MSERTERLVGALAVLTGLFGAGSRNFDGVPQAEIEAAGALVEPEFAKSSRLGVAIATIELETGPVAPGLSDPVIKAAVDALASLSTMRGPKPLWIFQNYCLRMSYYFARRPSAHPEDHIPPRAEVVTAVNSCGVYATIPDVIRLTWDACISVPTESLALR